MTDAQERLSYLPTDGLSYDPTEDLYWDEKALARETERVFEVCQGCRLCFKYCDAFPTLFDLVDGAHDGDVRKITDPETDRVFSHCFQCKLCEVQCPYTPRDGHEFRLDFPRLATRHEAVRLRTTGKTRRARILADPDRAASWARASLGVANKMNRVALHRWFLEKLIGIDRRKLLPEFAARTFESWARRTDRLREEPGGEAVLFPTCYVQHNEPQIGRDTVEVLEHNGIDLACTEGLVCCGMPAWEQGDIEKLHVQARKNLDVLSPYVEKGARVIAINPTCSMMMRREWPELLEGEDRKRAQALAEVVADPSEYLWSIRKEERFRDDFKTSPGERIAYHAPCHLRAQAIGFRGRDLIRKIPGTLPAMTMECCGHDGTWSMTVDGFEASQRIGARAFEGMEDADAAVWVTDCPLAALQFEQHAGRKALHPMTVLARAYRADGFPTSVPPPEQEPDA